jgi:hypothetical protein
VDVTNSTAGNRNIKIPTLKLKRENTFLGKESAEINKFLYMRT